DARGEIDEKGSDLGGDPEPRIVGAHRVEILGPALLDNIETHAKTRIQMPDGGRHDVRHHAGALAAAKHQQVDFSVRRRGVGTLAGCDHLTPQRSAAEWYSH